MTDFMKNHIKQLMAEIKYERESLASLDKHLTPSESNVAIDVDDILYDAYYALFKLILEAKDE